MGARETSSGRVKALDGVRGAAALAVVLHHCMLVSPLLMAAFRREGDVAVGSWQWWASRTPLHLLWAVDEAVVLLFVLSGFVLTLPVITPTGTWPTYYVKRVARLYLPAWASLLLALAIGAVSAPADPAQGAWVLERTAPTTAIDAIRDATLATPDAVVNGILWALHYELLFSLLLPLYLVFAQAARRWWPAKLAAAVAASAAGTVLDVTSLEFMPIFAVGAVLAAERHAIRDLSMRVRRWQWTTPLSLSGVLLIGRWIGIPGHIPFATVAAVVIVIAAQHHSATAYLASTPPFQCLGRISFSLYLVHEPIIVAVAAGTAATAPDLPLLVGVPIALVAAAVFYRLVERPSQRAASAAGRAARDAWSESGGR